MRSDITKEKTVCVVDSGYCVDLAVALSKRFKKVYYYTEWKQGAIPPLNYYYIGRGVKGIEKIESYLPYINKIDLFIFTEVYTGEEQQHLLNLGKLVYGCRNGEELELDRELFLDKLKELELKTPQYNVVVGFDNLRDYLSKNTRIWVKISKLRGFTETFFSPDYELIETFIDELEHKAGGMKDEIRFICFDELSDMPEIGYDTMYSNGYPDVFMCGIEVKDAGYCSVMKKYNDIPEPLKIIADKFDDVLNGYDYKGSVSTEVRIDDELNPYFLDMACRGGFPPTPTQVFNYKNLAEIYWGVANGEAVSPKYDKPYCVEVIIQTEWGMNNFLPIRVPKEIRKNVFLKNYFMRDGVKDVYYIVPTFNLEQIGSVIANGYTLDEAIENVKELCSKVEGIKISFPLDAIGKTQKQIGKLESLGINFFDDGEPSETFELEIEGDTFKIKNEFGIEVEIPNKYKIEVLDMLEEGCFECLEQLIEELKETK